MNSLFKKKTLFGVSPFGAGVSYVILGLWAFFILFPLYWLFITSVKEPGDVNNGPFYIPFVDFQPSLHAWRYILGDLQSETIPKFINTVGVSLISTAIAISFGASAAYALTRFQYRPKIGTIVMFIVSVIVAIVLFTLGVPGLLAAVIGIAIFLVCLNTLSKRFKRSLGNSNIAFWLISQRIMPPITVVIPIYVLFFAIQKGLGIKLLDTWAALIISYIGANLPIVVWLMRDYFENIPLELEESASIDGASRYRIFATVVLPLAAPGLVATFLFVLVFAWNEYLLALFLTSSVNAQTMPMFVVAQNATRGPQWWYLSVLVMIMIVPVIIMAIFLERYISRGLLVGAVKG